jgi:hypothetical protein
MGVHPGSSVVRAKGFLTGDVNRVAITTRMGAWRTLGLQGCTRLRCSPQRSDPDEQRNASSEPGGR